MMKKMKRPKKAMIDGDILVYHTAYWAESQDPDQFPAKLDSLMEQWIPDGVSRDDITVALSCSRSDNFRKQQWPKYKDNRKDSYVPEYLQDVRDWIQEAYDCMLLPSLEADDILGIYSSKGTHIAVTIDKDLQGTPGWHYNPDKDDDARYISEEEAYTFFCKQWMMGDTTDGIPGLWRVGPKKADKLLDEWDKQAWEENILEMYESDKYKLREDCDIPYPDIAIVMARCVKILTIDTYDLDNNEIKLWCPKVGS